MGAEDRVVRVGIDGGDRVGWEAAVFGLSKELCGGQPTRVSLS
jgi:hypothetical protein